MAVHFYSVSEFAEVLGFAHPEVNGSGYQRVLLAVRRGEIHAVKIGREWRVPATEVERLGTLQAAS